VPTHIELATLIPVSEHSDPAIRHFSGEVKYTTSFEQPPIGKQTQVVLDLHAVEGIAEVTLNGQAAGILWKPPWRLDVTRLLRLGKNKLSVAVTGTWRNRLIGEARYPNGFPDAWQHPAV
jgi:beta-galactosidase/beta-glucuronidase